MLNIAICLCKDPYCGMKPVLLLSALISVLSVKFATSQTSQKWLTLPESTENWTIVNDIDLLKTEGILVAADRPKNSADECDKVMNQPTDKRCKFIQSTPDCAAEDGFINYPWITFCMLPPQLLPVAIFLYVVWLLVLFLILGLIASEFFCPNLSAISSSLRLTHNVAGVTFLALGNGAPDVFSAMAAFSRPQTGGLAIGALFGAGIYVTTVVAGSIALVKPFRVASRPFLRDIIFYIAAVFWTFTILYKRHIDLKEALGYLGLYVLYVIVVIVSTYIYRHQNRSQPEPLQNYNITHDIQTEDSYSENLNGNTDVHEVEYEPLIPFTETTSNIFLKGINPVDSRTWRRSNWGWKAIKIIQFPFQVVLLLTVPVVDTDKEDRNWIRPLNSLHFITGPLVCVLTFNSGIYGLYLIEGEFPVWLLIGLIGVFLAGIVLCTTTNEHPPPYHSLFSLLGFVVSALWINTVASEVVSVLHLLGVTLSLSNTVLGLTLLAWGNSIGDTFADITLARQGYPRMAISACFGGIIFNMLFGIGLGCLLQMFHNGIIMLEPEGLLCWILAGALGLSLVLSFVLVPLQGFHLSRAYSIFLLFFYFVFLIVALLTEFGKIHI